MFYKYKQKKQCELSNLDVRVLSINATLYSQNKTEEKDLKEDRNVAAEQLKAIFKQLNKQEKQDIKYILKKMNARLRNLWKVKQYCGFNKLQKSDQIKVIDSFENSHKKKIKKAFRTFAMYITEVMTCRNKSSYPDYKYQNDFIDRMHLKIEKSQARDNQTIKTDFVIIGSGAGGAVAAAVLSKSGYKVVIIEKGPYLDRRDFSMTEGASRTLFDSAGIKFTKNKNMFLLSGSLLGGGSVVSWTSSFSAPILIRNQWDQLAQFNQVFSSQNFSNCEDIIKKRLNINSASARYQSKEQGCIKGLEMQGLNVQHTPRNVIHCDGTNCGFCVFGCKKGHKQSTLETWLRDAYQYGTKFYVASFVKELIINNNTVEGVRVINKVTNETFEVRAKATILAAGSLATPVIMQRSKLTHPKLGKQLSLHPTALVAARFDKKVYPWKGTPQGFFCDTFLSHDVEKYGYLIQSLPLHPARFISWFDGIVNKKKQQIIHEYPYWTGIGVVVADRGSGHVKATTEYEYECGYQLGYKDQKNLRHGLETVCTALYLGGADEIMVSTNPLISWQRQSTAPIEHLIKKLRRLATTHIIMGSTQQMGSAAMGMDPKHSICNENGAVHMTKNLYIMDGSVLPRSAGVPPEVSIQTIAYMNATKLSQLFKQKKRSKK